MWDCRFTLAEPLLVEMLPRGACCGGKVFRLLSLGFAVLLSMVLATKIGSVKRLAFSELAINMVASSRGFPGLATGRQPAWFSRQLAAPLASRMPDGRRNSRNSFARLTPAKSTSENSEIIDVLPLPATPPPPAETLRAEAMQLLSVRMSLLRRASGLDRGFIAREDDVRTIDDAARALEECPGVQAVDWTNEKDLNKLDGLWRLVYSSAFSTGTLGGARPGPSSNGPVRLGKVLQRIQSRAGRLDNIISPAYLTDSPWPQPLRQVLPSPEVAVELGHTMELVGKNKLRIISDSAKISPVVGSLELPPLSGETPKLPEELRALLPQQIQDSLDRQGSFRVAYLDDDLYVTRGDRDELRIFVRD